MRTFLRRLRGAIGMGIAWAVAWALTGLLIGVTSLVTPFLPWDTFFRFFDAPLPALAVPGFVGGAIFSVVLGVAARKRRFEEMSLPRFAAWGAVGGLLLSMVPAAMATVGLATLREDLSLIRVTATLAVPFIVVCAGSAAGSLWLARKGAAPRGAGAVEDPGDVGLSEAEKRELLGAGGAARAKPRESDKVRHE